MDDLFVFGDDFEAILGILEEDEAVEEEFTAVASDVSKKTVVFGLYSGCIATQQVIRSRVNSVV